MSASDKSPLQKAVADAIAASGKTRDNHDTALRKALNTSGKPLWDIERGKTKRPGPRVLRAIEEQLGFEPDELVNLVHPRSGEPPARPSDQPPIKPASGNETAPVQRLDLSYAMGPGTNLDDAHVEGEPVEFDIGFLRRLTPSPPYMLRIVSGVGDSMLPTVHDREDLIIDMAQRVLNMQDRIWAISLYGAGALKRLRTIGPGRVLVISDNPDVPDQEVSAEDISITGRLIGSIRRH